MSNPEQISESERAERKKLHDAFFRVHRDIPREGPGSAESTREALSLMKDLPQRPRILDLGCGPGQQTFELARLTGGDITALDSQQPFLDRLDANARSMGLSDRIKTVRGSMFDLPYADASFDAIWAEGSIYIIGFEKGLRDWRRFLIPHGYVAATHISWLAPDVPKEPRQFWEVEYPAIATIDANLQTARDAGYANLGHFILPESAWWEEYYGPLERRLVALRADDDFGDNQAMQSVVAETQREIDLYRRYAGVYGYVFYVMRQE